MQVTTKKHTKRIENSTRGALRRVAVPNHARRDPRTDRIGWQASGHDRAGGDDTASADGDAIQNLDASADPDVVVNPHTPLRMSLVMDRNVGSVEYMVERDDNRVRGNAHIVSDRQPPMAVDHSVRVEPAVVTHLDVATARQYERSDADLAVVTQGRSKRRYASTEAHSTPC